MRLGFRSANLSQIAEVARLRTESGVIHSLANSPSGKTRRWGQDRRASPPFTEGLAIILCRYTCRNMPRLLIRKSCCREMTSRQTGTRAASGVVETTGTCRFSAEVGRHGEASAGPPNGLRLGGSLAIMCYRRARPPPVDKISMTPEVRGTPGLRACRSTAWLRQSPVPAAVEKTPWR